MDTLDLVTVVVVWWTSVIAGYCQGRADGIRWGWNKAHEPSSTTEGGDR